MTQSTIQTTVGVILTVRRPCGRIEQVEKMLNTGAMMPAGLFSQVVKATRAAGRGEVLSQAPLYRTVEAAAPTDAELSDAAYHAQTAAIYRTSAYGRA